MKEILGINVLVFVIVWCTILSAEAGSIQPTLRTRLGELSPVDEVSIIVTLIDQQNLHQFRSSNKKLRRSLINKALRQKADSSQKPLRQFLKRKNAKKIIPFWIFNGMAVTLRADQVEELASRPEVKNVSLDNVFSIPALPLSQPGLPEWNLDAIHAPEIWDIGYKGGGVVIASMDTGVDVQHQDLALRWRGGSNSWFDPHAEHSTPHDSHGHGTQTMGVMVGGGAGGSSIGVAPDASWIAVKLYNDAGTTTNSVFHLGFQWLLDPDGNPETDDLPDVVNGSWGFDELVNVCNTEFKADIQALKDAEIAVVFSAGNAGPLSSTSVSPANYPQSFAVGSVDENHLVANHSSRGPSTCDAGIFPQIVSPGVNIKTTDLSFGGLPDSYIDVIGTSIAAPHVSGAMALLLSVNPQLTVNQLEATLVQSANDLGDPGPDNQYGNGMLDLQAAFDLFDTFMLNVHVDGKGGGNIKSDAPGINCPGDCQGEYVDGRVITLTATAAPNSRFVGWGGDCAGKGFQCQVTMDQLKNVTGLFTSFPWPLLVPIITKQTP